MATIGTKEWFHDQAKLEINKAFQAKIEGMRASFVCSFSPEKLEEMSDAELLQKVFGNVPDSMMRILMRRESGYNIFGSPGDYKYLGIVYQPEGKAWQYLAGSSAQELTNEDAAIKARQVIDALIACAKEIAFADISTIQGYSHLESTLASKAFFYKYPWALKYFQMLFPYYFPGMYSDETLDRALEILGLPKHKSHKMLKIGELSIFIRRCDVNNIVFNKIYSDEWGWSEKIENPCPGALENQKEINVPAKVNNEYYEIPSLEFTQKKELEKEAAVVEQGIKEYHVEGAEKEAIVKIRINQGKFRESLIKRYKSKCCLCGVAEERLLVASHIKPWAASEPDEKADPNNGFLFCPNHDKLFDQGFISFEEDGQIIISPQLDESDCAALNINENMQIKVLQGNCKYLDYHRHNIFKYK